MFPYREYANIFGGKGRVLLYKSVFQVNMSVGFYHQVMVTKH